jgi:hypothetical protein
VRPCFRASGPGRSRAGAGSLVRVSASRVLRLVGLLIALGAVALVLVPFRADVPVSGSGALQGLQSSCGPPITEAFRKPASGWFGYAVAAGHRAVLSGHVGCTRPARDRFRISVAALFLALLLAVAASLLAGRGFGWWRHGLQPAP